MGSTFVPPAHTAPVGQLWHGLVFENEYNPSSQGMKLPAVHSPPMGQGIWATLLVGGVEGSVLSGQLVEWGLGTLQLPSATVEAAPPPPGQKNAAAPQGLGSVEPCGQ